MGSSAQGLTLTRLAEGRIEAIALWFVHDGVHDAAHGLADLAYHGIDLALMREGGRQDLPQRVEPGIDGRGELLMTGYRQVHLQRRLVDKTIQAPVDIDERTGAFQALNAPHQLSHTPPCYCAQDPRPMD
jgi:hypothetical protein